MNDRLIVLDLLSSSEHLGVTTPEALALHHLTERVDQWKEKVRTALASDCFAQICRLISAETLHQEKPINSDAETTTPTDQSDLLSTVERSPELGITDY